LRFNVERRNISLETIYTLKKNQIKHFQLFTKTMDNKCVDFIDNVNSKLTKLSNF